MKTINFNIFQFINILLQCVVSVNYLWYSFLSQEKVSIRLQSLKKKKDKFFKLVFLQSLWKGTVLAITFSTTHQAQGTVPML